MSSSTVLIVVSLCLKAAGMVMEDAGTLQNGVNVNGERVVTTFTIL